jgi:hypothetical protein
MEHSMKTSLRNTVLSTALLSLGTACTSTPTVTTDVWHDPSYSAGPMRNIVIVGARVDDTHRRVVEDAFASAIATPGVHATPSYVLFPGALPDRVTAHNTLLKGGYDGALVATMRGIHERITIVPGAGWDAWGAWGAYGYSAASEGYVVTDQYVRFETALWDPRGAGKMVWSAVTQTENPTSGNDFARSLVNEIVPALWQAGFIPRSPAPGKDVSFLVK